MLRPLRVYLIPGVTRELTKGKKRCTKPDTPSGALYARSDSRGKDTDTPDGVNRFLVLVYTRGSTKREYTRADTSLAANERAP